MSGKRARSFWCSACSPSTIFRCGPWAASVCIPRLHVFAGGAAGVVLDSQVLLTPESNIPAPVRAALARPDGGETVCLGQEVSFRCFGYINSLAARRYGSWKRWSNG